MALVSFQDLSSQEAGNPYTTPVQPLSFDDFTTTSSGLPDLEPLNFSSQEVTSTGVTQYVNYTTTQTNTVHRNNTTFEEMVVTSVCYQKHILHDGTVLENESKLAIRSWTDEHGNYHWVDDDNKQGTRDHQGQTESTENHFSCSDRLVEETNYRRFYTTFEPEQFAVEDMVFEYMEDHREFELYDFAVNFPDQTDVLCKNNLSKLIDKIVPFAEEQGRLEDVNMLASSHVYDYQLNVRRGHASSSEMMQLNNNAQLCLEYIPVEEKEKAPEELVTLSSVAEAESVVLTKNDVNIKTPCSLDSSCRDLGLKDMFMSPSSSSSSLSTIDSTSSCYGLKDLFMSPSSSSSSLSSINSTSSCYNVKDLFMSPSSSSNSIDSDSTSSCCGLKDLFMSPSHSVDSNMSVIPLDDDTIPLPRKHNFGSPLSSCSDLSGFNLFEDAAPECEDPDEALILTDNVPSTDEVCVCIEDVESQDATVHLFSYESESSPQLSRDTTAASSKLDTHIDIDSFSFEHESTPQEEMKADIDASSPFKASRLGRLRSFLRSLNIFAGVICAKIVCTFVQNFPVM